MTAIPHETHGPIRSGRPLTFSLIGAAVFAVHFSVVVVLVPLGVAPLIANVPAFIAALVAGLIGHHRWTLRAQGRRRGAVLRRFAWVALGGFALNEANYAALLFDTDIDYRFGLLLVLAAVAALTRVVARDWVFVEV